MKKTLLFVGLLLAAAFTSHAWAGNYEPVTNSPEPTWHSDFTFTSGLPYSSSTSESKFVHAVWVDGKYAGQSLNSTNGKKQPFKAGEPVTMKFANGYSYEVGGVTKTYDLYVKVTASETLSSPNWIGRIETASDGVGSQRTYHQYVRIMPTGSSSGGVATFEFEAWLTNPGETTVAQDAEFVAGNCYVNQSEYVRIFGTEKIVYSNIERSKMNYVTTKSGTTWNGWVGTSSSYDKPNLYLIGAGYDAQRHVHMAYGCTQGYAEFVIGYLSYKSYIITPDEAIEITYRLNDTINLCDLTPNYSGWVVKSDSVVLINDSVIYKEGIITENVCQIKSTGTLKLQAYKPFDVTFKPNAEGATVTPTKKEVKMGALYGTLPTPERFGYTFDGWFTEATGGDLITEDNYVMDSLAHNLYAHWTIKPVEGRQVTDGTGMTLADAKKQINDSLTSWYDQSTSNYINVTIVRNIYKDGFYNTLCLPFDATAEQIEDAFLEEPKELKKFVSATVVGNELQLTLETVTTIVKGEPYLISFNNGATMPSFTFNNIKVELKTPDAKSGDNYYQGLFAPVQLDAAENLLFLGENNTLYWPKADGTFLRGFRAYFNVTRDSQGAPVRRGMKASFSKQTPTANANVNANADTISKMIQDGRVVIMCDGVKYDLLGNVIK